MTRQQLNMCFLIECRDSSQCPRYRIWLRVCHLSLSTRLQNTNTIQSDGQENGTVVPGLAVPDKYLRPFTSVPQPGLENRTSPLYTGAVVGGGTVVNGMFFNRGSAVDYDAWEKLGNPGWGWNDLLPYFKKVKPLHGSALCKLMLTIPTVHRARLSRHRLWKYRSNFQGSSQLTCRHMAPKARSGLASRTINIL